MEMDFYQVNLMTEAMNQIIAREHLRQMDIVQYPNLKPRDSRKRHKKWSKIAYPERFEQKVIRNEDLRLST